MRVPSPTQIPQSLRSFGMTALGSQRSLEMKAWGMSRGASGACRRTRARTRTRTRDLVTLSRKVVEVWYQERMKRLLIALPILFLAACAGHSPEPDPAYRGEIEQWRSQRVERLTADNGWLTLVGLDWLQPGENRLGSAPDNEIALSAPGVPPVAGTLEVTEDGAVRLHPAEGSGLTVNGEPATEKVLATDADGRPDVLGLGRLSFYVIARGDRLGVRIKDPEAAPRREFKGIQYFPIDPSYRVTATFEPYETPREVQVPTAIGTPATMLAPGILHFTLKGQSLTLEPYRESPDAKELFIVFRDATSGETTYGGGRFLSAPTPGADNTTVLDFNRAYNPPCAFTPYATCPLPTQQNTLAVPVEAGEKHEGGGH